MALVKGGIVNIAIGIFILVITVAYMTMMTADIEEGITINATESPEAASAVEDIFAKSYKAQKMMGNVITLTVVGAIIFIVSGFILYTQR